MAKLKQEVRKTDDTLIDVVEIREQAGDFLERYRNIILGVVGALALLVVGFFAYNQFYLKPKQQEAIEQMFQAQVQFERDSFQLALVNPGGGYIGFLDVIENYGGTSAANIANYYAGICYLHLGQYSAAVSYLKDFNAKGDVMPIMKNGALGDAYSESNDFEGAMDYYEKAVSAGKNEILTPYYLKKIGMLHEKNGNQERALKAYQRIKDEYPDPEASPDARDIEKYIIRVSPKG